MICRKCGNNINDGQKFCTVCGSPIEELTQTPVQPVTPNPQAEDIFTGSEQPSVNTPVNNTNEPTYVQTSVVGTYPVYETKKQSNLWFILTCIVLGVIILISTGVIVKKSMNLAKSNGKIDYLEDVDIYEDEEEVIVTNENTYIVDGYKFVIPTGFKKIVKGDDERIGDGNFEIGSLKIDNTYSYSAYKDNINDVVATLKEKFGAQGATYIETSEKTYGGQKFLIFSFMYNSIYNDFTLTELSDGSVLGFTAVYAYSTYRESGFAKTAKFVKSADSSSGRAVSGSIDFNVNVSNGLN